MNKLEIMLAEMTLAVRDGNGFEVSIKSPELPKVEIISNPPENVKEKRDYYAKAYNNSLELMGNTKISIVGYRVISNQYLK